MRYTPDNGSRQPTENIEPFGSLYCPSSCVCTQFMHRTGIVGDVRGSGNAPPQAEPRTDSHLAKNCLRPLLIDPGKQAMAPLSNCR